MQPKPKRAQIRTDELGGGTDPKTGRPWPKRDWQTIHAQIEAGVNLRDVAKQHKVQLRTLRRYAAAHHLKPHITYQPPPIIDRTPRPDLPKPPGHKGTRYTKNETGDIICARIADGEGLKNILLSPGMPSAQTVYRWIREDPEFRAAYQRARETQAETMADQIVEIADTESDPHRARVRIDARRWLASKLRPDKYGDKIQVDQQQTLKVEAIRRVIVDDKPDDPAVEMAQKGFLPGPEADE